MQNTEKPNLKELMETYRPQWDILTQEDLRTLMLKTVIFEDLTEVERRVILLYVELQSQRKLGKLMGLSAATVNKILKEIKQKIHDNLDRRIADSADMRYGY